MYFCFFQTIFFSGNGQKRTAVKLRKPNFEFKKYVYWTEKLHFLKKYQFFLENINFFL